MEKEDYLQKFHYKCHSVYKTLCKIEHSLVHLYVGKLFE